MLKYFHDSITLQIRLDLKYISNAANQFEDLVSEWTIFVHEKDQIAWDYSNLFGSSYLGFFDSHIPMYNETFSIFSPYTILYNDVTHLSKEDRPCTDDPGSLIENVTEATSLHHPYFSDKQYTLPFALLGG